MKAIYFNSYGGPEVLHLGDFPDPVPAAGQLLIQVKAVSINPMDYKIIRGNLKMLTGSKFPKIPCTDFAGIVKESSDPGFNPCDKVYGYIPTILKKPGSLAELTLALPNHVRLLPEGMIFEEAASLPIACLTALNGLRKGGELKGKSVLINGATGGVGHYAVQIARIKGAQITGTCSSANLALAIKLGCDDVFNYTKESLKKIPGRYDLILDSWGKMDKKDILRLLNKNGVYATTQLRPVIFFSNIVKHFVSGKIMTSANMRAKSEDFDEMEDLFKKGMLRPYIEQTFNLDNAIDAFRLAESGKQRGKIVVRI